MLRVSAFGLAALTLAFGVQASASLMVENSPLLGASSVVLDTDTGLYWIKPVLTLGQSYAAVQAEEGFGDYTGFTLATTGQLDTLFSDGGIPNIINTPSPSYYSADLAFIDVFGETGTETGFVNGVNYDEIDLDGIYLNSIGFETEDPLLAFVSVLTTSGPFDNCMDGTQCGEASINQYFGGTTTPDDGAWLVASSLASTPVFPPAPEPATLFLGGTGLLFVGLRVRSRAR